MIIATYDFRREGVNISLEAESEAEKHQLRSIMDDLTSAGAEWNEWDNMEGRSGITIFAKKKPLHEGLGRESLG